jgi:hypothetical protein
MSIIGIQHLAPEVIVVILNWNTHQETIAAVESVLKMDYPSLRVAVVDNGSSDDPGKALAPILNERVDLIRSPVNVGFTGGCNLGIDLALHREAAYVWLLNGDAITEVSTLSSLVAIAEADMEVGLVSPLIATWGDPTRLMNAGGIYDPAVPDYDTTKKIEQARDWAVSRPGSVTLLGTAMLIRVELIKKIGKLDHIFFAYFEDADYSVRSIQAGYRNVVDFNSFVYHREKSTAFDPHGVKPHYWYYMSRNEIFFWKRYSVGSARLKKLWWNYLFQQHHLNQLEGNEDSRRAILAGLWDGWTNRTGAYDSSLRMPAIFAYFVEAHARRRRRLSPAS